MSLIHVRLSQNHMATTFDLKIACQEYEKLRAHQTLIDCHKLIHAIELDCSEFLSDSSVYRLNHGPTKQPIPVSKHVIHLLDRSHFLMEATENAFNIGVKSLVPLPPSVHWDSEDSVAWKTDPRYRVGFGAIGKGYALDQCRTLIEQSEFQHYVLSAGGSSLILSGQAADDAPWEWGWAFHKNGSGEYQGIPLTHTGSTVAVGVSGILEKGEHIVVAKNHRLLSALVATTSATDADALSTALFANGWNESHRTFQKFFTLPAMATVNESLEPEWNGTFEELWGPLK